MRQPTDRTVEMTQERGRGHGWGSIRAARWNAVSTHAVGPVLDVGCSGGAYVRKLQETGTEAVGLDLLADEEWTTGPRTYVRGDAASLPFCAGSFATVVAFETLEHLPEPRVALRDWRRVARERLILSVPNADVPSWGRSAGLTFHHYVDRTHVNFFDEPALRSMLTELGFRVETVVPILPINPFLPALHALGLPARLAEAIARRIGWLIRRPVYTGLLAIADVA